MNNSDDSGQIEQAAHIVGAMMEKDAFSQWLGIQVLETGPGSARLRMTVREEMTNGFGVCHGGVSFSLADSALAFASNSHGQMAMSIEAGMSYPKKILPYDQLTAVARELSIAGPIANYDVTVTNQNDEVVGLFRGTVYRSRKSHTVVEP